MAAELMGGAFLSSFLNVVFDRLSKPEVVNWIRGKKLDQKLLQRLENILYVVQAVLNDAEQKQITDPAVKKWLVNLQDAIYKADDLLDEVSTKAATQKHAGDLAPRRPRRAVKFLLRLIKRETRFLGYPGGETRKRNRERKLKSKDNNLGKKKRRKIGDSSFQFFGSL